MTPWTSQRKPHFCLPGEALVAPRCDEKPLFVTWPVSRSLWKQNLAIFDPNRLTVAPETWCLQVAARWGFLKIDPKTVKIHLGKYPPRGHLETPSSWHHSGVTRDQKGQNLPP